MAVVEEPLDVIALEKTKLFKGTYHVLGGAISPIDGIGPDQLHIPELIERLTRDNVEEIILAMNSSVEGESTALYLQNSSTKQTSLSKSPARPAVSLSASTSNTPIKSHFLMLSKADKPYESISCKSEAHCWDIVL